MSDVLSLQDDNPDAPAEEKRSYWSLTLCHNSYKSIAVCKVTPV